MVNWEQELLIWEHKWLNCARKLLFSSVKPLGLCYRATQVRQRRHRTQTSNVDSTKWLATWVAFKCIWIKARATSFKLDTWLHVCTTWLIFLFVLFSSSLNLAALKLPPLLHTLVPLMIFNMFYERAAIKTCRLFEPFRSRNHKLL